MTRRASKPTAVKLTKAEKLALRQIENGADVTGYALAKTLREIESKAPQYIEITKVMGEYDGAGQVPYFGAIATSEGMRVANSWKDDGR